MRRPLILGAAWTASAAAAVGLGFLAVSLVDATASPGTSLAGATGTAATTAPPAAPPTDPGADPTVPGPPSARPATGEYATAGGTVYADCSSGSPVVAGAPAAGWSVDDSPDPGEMEFERGDDDKVEVHVVCVDGAPQFFLDDSSVPGAVPGAPSAGPTGGPTASPVPSAPSSSSGGHGHGSDDPPGDDHGGDRDRGDDDRGGHGSDD